MSSASEVELARQETGDCPQRRLLLSFAPLTIVTLSPPQPQPSRLPLPITVAHSEIFARTGYTCSPCTEGLACDIARCGACCSTCASPNQPRDKENNCLRSISDRFSCNPTEVRHTRLYLTTAYRALLDRDHGRRRGASLPSGAAGRI